MSKNIMSWQALILIYSNKEDLNTIYRQMYSAATRCVGESDIGQRYLIFLAFYLLADQL